MNDMIAQPRIRNERRSSATGHWMIIITSMPILMATSGWNMVGKLAFEVGALQKRWTKRLSVTVTAPPNQNIKISRAVCDWVIIRRALIRSVNKIWFVAHVVGTLYNYRVLHNELVRAEDNTAMNEWRPILWSDSITGTSHFLLSPAYIIAWLVS